MPTSTVTIPISTPEVTTEDDDDEDTTTTVQEEEVVTLEKTESLTPIDTIVVTPTQLDIEDVACQTHVCRNEGKCISTIEGPKCQCPLQFKGRQCEEELFVNVPGFIGHSLLVHDLAPNVALNQEGFHLMLSFRTSSPDGVVFHAGGTYTDHII